MEPMISALGPGRVVAVGGGLQAENAAVYQAVLAARMGDGPICVLPTASANPEGSAQSTIDAFERYAPAGVAIGIPISEEAPEAAMDESIAAQLSTCSGYWFVGGQQSRIARVFDPDGMSSPALRAIKARLVEGAVVSGSSAGAAILSDPMINGGSSAAALETGVGPESGAGVIVTGGGGFSEGVLLDQHFLARGRFARLVVALLDASTPEIGVGIDENTAFVIDSGLGTVIGASQSILVDVRGAAVVRNAEGGIQSAEGVRIELLAPGDQVDLATIAVMRSASSTITTPGSAPVVAPDDPFDGRAMQGFLVAFGAAAQESASVQNESGLVLTLQKASGFAAAFTGNPGWCMPPTEQGSCWPVEPDAPTDPPANERSLLPSLSAGPFTLSIGPNPAG